MKFPLGRVVATPGALAALERAGETPARFLKMHCEGDFGVLDPKDIKVQNHSLREEKLHGKQAAQRMLSAYKLTDHTTIWVITEWDRSSTTILLPSEY